MKEADRPLKISASGIKAYEHCALSYALTYVEPLPREQQEPIPAFAFGNAVHAAIAQFVRTGGHAKRSLDDLVELGMRNWRSEAFASEAESYEQFTRAREQLESFYFLSFPPSGSRELGVEKYASWRAARRGILATGRFDRVVMLPDDTLTVIDYKTGGRIPERGAVERDLQSIIYRSIAADEFRRLKPARIAIAYVFLAAPKVVTVSPSLEVFRERWASIETTVAAIRRDRGNLQRGLPLDAAFVPNRGGHCAWCPFRTHCASRYPVPDGAAAS